jgi:hypothetical protein
MRRSDPHPSSSLPLGVSMRTNLARRFVTGLALLAAVLAFAPAALAADSTTQKIINDVAKDGRVDGAYTSAQLRAALATPLLGQYGGNNGVAGVQAALGKPKGSKNDTGTAPAASNNNNGGGPGNSGTSSPGVAGTGTTNSGNLPFTGSDLALFVGLGGVLVVAGFALRRLGREREPQA